CGGMPRRIDDRGWSRAGGEVDDASGGDVDLFGGASGLGIYGAVFLCGWWRMSRLISSSPGNAVNQATIVPLRGPLARAAPAPSASLRAGGMTDGARDD